MELTNRSRLVVCWCQWNVNHWTSPLNSGKKYQCHHDLTPWMRLTVNEGLLSHFCK